MKIWIVGASFGIGRRIALQYLKMGHSVALSARNGDELKKLHQESGVDADKVHILPFDVCDASKVRDAFDKIVSDWGGVDLFIYCSGIYKPMPIDEIDTQYAKKTIDVNLTAIFDFLGELIPSMKQQKSGHIVLVSSCAGYVGLPKSYAYGASKAAIINLAEGLYSELSSYGVRVSVVNPGFVKTRLTARNTFDMPSIISTENAAQKIIKGIENNKFDINFPKRFTLILKVIANLPYWLLLRILKRIK